MNEKIIPVILAGGSGTRLWPLSRKRFPKQFLKLIGNHSLLQETVIRIKKVVDFSNLIVITNVLHHHLCEEQLKNISLSASVSYILEPVGRNTAPAIAIAAQYIKDHIDENALMLVLPSDHLIAEVEELTESLSLSKDPASDGNLVIFGVTPNSPKTGYGYIRAEKNLETPPYPVSAFVEKPSLERAEKFLASGEYYWNSGMFLFRPSSYLKELEVCTPNIYAECLSSFEMASLSETTLTLEKESFSKCPSDSIDYAVMEKTSKAVMTPLHATWNDLGSWIAIAETHANNVEGNVTYGNVIEKDTTNCFIHSDNKLVSAIGLDNHIVISTQDAVLVANKIHIDKIKEVVNELDSTHSKVVENHQKIFFKWGYEEAIEKTNLSEQRRLVIKPGANLVETAPHKHLSHLLVISGDGLLSYSGETHSLLVNQSFCLRKSEEYTLSNTGDAPLILLEVLVKSQVVASELEKTLN